MKTFKIIFAMLFAFAITQSVQAQSDKSVRVKAPASSIVSVQYSCPMHSEVISDKAEKCSKCGMGLNLSKKELLKQENVKNTAIMHPQIISSTTVQCPKSGFNSHLSLKEQRKLEVANGYTCPVHSDKPGKYATCGMYQTKVKIKKG